MRDAFLITATDRLACVHATESADTLGTLVIGAHLRCAVHGLEAIFRGEGVGEACGVSDFPDALGRVEVGELDDALLVDQNVRAFDVVVHDLA